MARSRAPRQPLWLITNHDNGRMGVFILGSDDEETLPVFSFEAEAEAFLRLGETETGWWARETTAGELISLLHGPCAGVKRVTLDPLPVVDGGMVFDLVGRGRRDFLRDFVGATPASNSERWAEGVVVSPGLLESQNGDSPDGKGPPSRETEEERGRTENGATTRRNPESIRDELL